jgi:ubiquinone/menaquinone biosynthesis C-methylase UbiE
MSLLVNPLKVSTDKTYYDQEKVGSRIEHENWMREIAFYFAVYSDKLNCSLSGTCGKVAELGAGSCGLSACLSRLPNVSHVSAIDISMDRMQKMIGLSCEILDGKTDKVEPISSDFNAILPFEDESLDAVLFDAALHHTRSMWHLLSECNRILKKNGLLIAQRESYLSAFRAKMQLNRLLLTSEVSSNVSENMYLKEQYLYYLRANGFCASFLPVTASRIKSFLGILNGIIFCDGVLWCCKQ